MSVNSVNKLAVYSSLKINNQSNWMDEWSRLRVYMEQVKGIYGAG